MQVTSIDIGTCTFSYSWRIMYRDMLGILKKWIHIVANEGFLQLIHRNRVMW